MNRDKGANLFLCQVLGEDMTIDQFDLGEKRRAE